MSKNSLSLLPLPMDKLDTKEQARVLLARSTKLLTACTECDRKDDYHVLFNVNTMITRAEVALMIARELEDRAKNLFNISKNETIIEVNGLRPMTETEYEQFKKFETE